MAGDLSTVIEPNLMDMSQLQTQWARIRGRLQSEVGDVEYRNWLRQMTLASIDGDEITVLLPTRFLADWVRSRYGDRLNALWQSENPAIRRIEIRVGGAAAPTSGLAESLAAPSDQAPVVTNRSEERMDQRSELQIDPRFTFDAFVVGKPNEFAYACARRVAEQPSSPGFNPLFLYGGVGLGKTHLMHAIAWEMVARNGNGACRKPVSVTYMSAEKFMYRFIAAIRSQSTMQFKEQLRSVDVLMIDDLQFLIGKDNTQEEFFHTFNALVDVGKQIVVSADKSPSDLSGLDDRLRTRLGYGMVADLHATTFELRISILEAKAARAGVVVPAKVMDFLAQRITGNVRELEGALNRLVAHANLFGRPGDAGDDAGSAARHPQGTRPADHHRGDPEEGRGTLLHPHHRHVLGAAGAQRGAAAAGGDVSGQAAHPAQPAGHRPAVRRPRPHHGDARGLPRRRADEPRRRLRRGRRTAAENAGILTPPRPSSWITTGLSPRAAPLLQCRSLDSPGRRCNPAV